MGRDKELQWFYEKIIELKEDLFCFAYSILHSVPECEDAVSSAIVKAHTHIDALRNRKALKPWLFQIVKNECYGIVSARQRSVPIDANAPYHHDPKPEQRLDVENALAQLPQEQSTAITLYYICGYSIKEISKILEIPSGTVKSRLSRARAELKKALGDEYHEA